MRSHYIPQKYLKGFCGEERPSEIWAYDKNGCRRFPVGVRRIAVEHGYYPEDAEKDMNIEVEAPANGVLDRIYSQNVISIDEKRTLSNYIALMYTRVPKHRERVDRLLANRGKEVFGREFPDANLEEVATAAKLPFLSHRTSRLIAEMTWRFATRDGASYFLTSDNPLFIFPQWGLANGESEFSFPISRDVALLANWQVGQDLSYYPIEEKHVRSVNKRTASSASRFLFYPKEEEWVTRLAARNRHELFRLAVG